MKKNILLIFIFASFGYCFNMPNMDAYNNMFEELKTKRVGLNSSQINSLKDPFFVFDETKMMSKKNNSIIGKKLTAILSNKVKINGNWYKIGENFGSYKIKEIKEQSVIIENKEENLELKLNQGNDNVTITYK